MANLASALKEEIGRLARKEIRQQTAGTARTVAQCEREIAALKRQIGGLQRMLSAQRPQGAPGPTASKKTGRKKVAAAKPAAKAAPDSGSKRSRFSAKGLKANRERLGLSADNYGKLIGVSGLSIYNWEQGKARPRESSIAALMSIRGIGKREAARRLGGLAAPKAKTRAKAKVKTTTRKKARAKTAAKAGRPAKETEAASAGQDGKES
jgi:DNA-binding transcriptional regulator YiaG